MPFIVRPLALKAHVGKCAISGSAAADGFFRFDFVLCLCLGSVTVVHGHSKFYNKSMTPIRNIQRNT